MSEDDSAYYVSSGGSSSSCGQQRIRNVLTLEERVAAIRQYDIEPMYSKIAKNFNCSWEQIKSIVANREPILEFYEATRRTNKQPNSKREELRRRKLNLLGQSLYEYIQRAQYHLHADINEELIRTKALEFRDLMHIDNFMPNKPWINHFKAAYNITLSNRQITMTRRPPRSLDLRNILSYCGKQALPGELPPNASETQPTNAPAAQLDAPLASTKPIDKRCLYRTKTQAAISSVNQAVLEEVQQRRKRKINFLEKALFEYIQRSQLQHKGRLDLDNLRTVAISLRDILKIENFFPDKMWFNHFKSHYNFNFSQGVSVPFRRWPLSLDLRDIVSYCGRHEQRNITLSPKESPEPAPKPFVHLPFVEPKPEPGEKDEDDDDCVAIEVPTELIEIKDDDEECNQTSTKRSNDDASAHCPSPLKIQKIESLHMEGNIEQQQRTHSPGHYSEDSNEAQLPRCVETYADALRLLKPLEEFALMQENYRAIGLLTQLEKMFESAKQPQTQGE